MNQEEIVKINKRFDGIEKNINALLKQHDQMLKNQENQEAHYKVRIQNQENINNNIKTIMDALVETPLNDGGVIKKVKEHSVKLQNHSEALSNHKAFFILLGSGLIVGVSVVIAIVNNIKH